MVGTSDGPAADEKCAKFYKLQANYGREFRLRTPPPDVYVSIIISFIIEILTDPLPPNDKVTIMAVF